MAKLRSSYKMLKPAMLSLTFFRANNTGEPSGYRTGSYHSNKQKSPTLPFRGQHVGLRIKVTTFFNLSNECEGNLGRGRKLL